MTNIPFTIGLAISILGLHELCHIVYCKIKGLRIIGIHLGFKSMGIKVENPSPKAYLSSLFSIPIVIISSIVLQLLFWVVIFNLTIVCFAVTNDVKKYLSK